MFSRLALRRVFPAFALVAVFLAACNESTAVDDEPEVATMRLSIGTSTVNVAENGTVTGGPLLLTTSDQLLSATFLRADGSVESKVNDVVFRLDVTGGTGVTFTRVSPFTGNIRGAAAATTTVTFGLFHTEENHTDFGPFQVPVQIQ